MARTRHSNERTIPIAVPESMYKFLSSKKRANEPLYVVINRIVHGFYDSEEGKKDEELTIAYDSIKKYQKRVVELESKLQKELIDFIK